MTGHPTRPLGEPEPEPAPEHPTRRLTEPRPYLRAGAAIEATRVPADVALLLSYESRFAFQIQPNNPGYDYKEHFQSVYRAFHARNIAVDVLAPTDDLRGYRLVLAPPLYVLPATAAANLESYVRGGGTLVCFFRSGVKDESNAVVNRPLPGLLAEVCGVEVGDYDSFPPGAQNGLAWAVPELAGAAPGVARAWADILVPNGAQVVARYSQDYYAGQPAITLNHYGAGGAIYVGTAGDEATHATLASWLIAQTGVQAPLAAPAGVEVTERVDGERHLLFVLNHTAAPQDVLLTRPYHSLGLEYYGPALTLVGIERQANELGYSVLLNLLHDPESDAIEPVLADLQARQVDGILWAVPEVGDNYHWVQPHPRQVKDFTIAAFGLAHRLSACW